MSKIHILLFAIVLLNSCLKETKPLNESVIARAYSQELKHSDIASITEMAKQSNDSIGIVKEYLKQWAIDQILYHKAIQIYESDAQIERQVEAYRMSLMIEKYKQTLAYDNDTEPTEAKIKAFYELHKEQYILSQPIIKGGFVSIPKNYKDIKKVKKAIATMTNDDIDLIERLSLKNTINYTFFKDDWISVEELKSLLPPIMLEPSIELSNRKLYHTRDSISNYFLSITDYKSKGEQMPYEIAKPQIKYILKENNKDIFYQQYMNDIFEKEKNRGNIIIKE